MAGDKVVDGGVQGIDAAVDAAPDLPLGEQGEEPLDLVEPRRTCWGQMDMPAWSARQPVADQLGRKCRTGLAWRGTRSEVEQVVALAMPTAANLNCCRRSHRKSRLTLNIGHNHEPVILIPVAVELVVMFQFEIAFFKPYFFRQEHAAVCLVRDGENYPAFPNQISAASEFLPANPDPKYHPGAFVVMRHRKLASLGRVARRGEVCPA